MTNLQQIVQNAYNNLPQEKKTKPWTFVNHGVDLLNTEDELNCYLAAYGTMHEEKIKIALENLDDRLDSFKNDIQIIDWGCGQGLASLCFIEYLNGKGLLNRIKSIILIEPSKIAIHKANEYLSNHLDLTKVSIELIPKYLDEVIIDDIKSSKPTTINFFSNILDINTVDIDKLSNLVKENLFGQQYFVCVGPLNYGSTRIDKFAEALKIPETQTIDHSSGKLENTRGTIKSMVFKIEGQKIEIIKTIYYPPMPKNENYAHILGKLLDKIDPNKLSNIDKIIEYYKTVVELEQLKEPAIDQYFYYKYQQNEENTFAIDLESNTDFLLLFRENLEKQFPKDLIISIEMEANNEKYTILSYSYLFDDIKGINTETEKINIKLTDFELNYSVLSNFNKTSEEIDELEAEIKEKATFDEIISLISNKLENIFTFDEKLSLALSSKNPALLQIYSELRRINQSNIVADSLLSHFLLNQSFDNSVEKQFNSNDLIQITQLDPSQQKAVETTLNQKLTVITGPPGSGKTQVIANILANAIMQNKKVLVASKNNQAVDNVKSRFDREESIGYFLRVGSKRVLTEHSCPEIDRVSTFKNSLEDNSDILEENKRNLRKIITTKNENQVKLDFRDKLVKDLPNLQSKLRNLQQELSKLEENNNQLNELRKNHSINEIDGYSKQFKNQRRELETNYSGLGKLWIDWFTKKKKAAQLLEVFENLPLDIRENFNSVGFSGKLSDYKNGQLIIDAYNSIINHLNLLISFLKDYLKKEKEVKDSNAKLQEAIAKIEEINRAEPEIKRIITDCNNKIIPKSKIVLANKIENMLFNSPTAYINNYRNYLPDNIPWQFTKIPNFIANTHNFLDVFNIISVTSLSAKASLPLTRDLFDMVIIDEASQCDIASAIPLILRAKQLVIIGDPLQLKHISTIEKYEQEKIKEHLQITNASFLNYKEKSLWDYCKDLLANTSDKGDSPINLNYHYRCHPEIIGYSNEAFYIPRLQTNLKICTKDENYEFTPKGIQWENVTGVQRANNVNINDMEVMKCVELASRITRDYSNFSIGIVTPFRHQANEIYDKLPADLKEKITVDTIYKFQGDEKDIMIYSLVVTSNSPNSKINWIDNGAPEMINVAITRARNTLFIVGNKEYIKAHSATNKPLGQLVQYIENLK